MDDFAGHADDQTNTSVHWRAVVFNHVKGQSYQAQLTKRYSKQYNKKDLNIYSTTKTKDTDS